MCVILHIIYTHKYMYVSSCAAFPKGRGKPLIKTMQLFGLVFPQENQGIGRDDVVGSWHLRCLQAKKVIIGQNDWWSAKSTNIQFWVKHEGRLLFKRLQIVDGRRRPGQTLHGSWMRLPPRSGASFAQGLGQRRKKLLSKKKSILRTLL